MKTLPTLAREWNASIDILRKLLQRDAGLNNLGIKIGVARAYDAAEAATLKAALDAHLARVALRFKAGAAK